MMPAMAAADRPVPPATAPAAVVAIVAPAAAAAVAVAKFVCVIVAVTACPSTEALTLICTGPVLIGVSDATAARPAALVVTLIVCSPPPKVAFGPAIVKLTGTPATGKSLRSRTSTTGASAVFR
jgi:hypothetical protein